MSKRSQQNEESVKENLDSDNTGNFYKKEKKKKDNKKVEIDSEQIKKNAKETQRTVVIFTGRALVEILRD